MLALKYYGKYPSPGPDNSYFVPGTRLDTQYSATRLPTRVPARHYRPGGRFREQVTSFFDVSFDVSLELHPPALTSDSESTLHPRCV